MTKFGKWKVKTPTSENHRSFRVLSTGSWCHAKPFIPKLVLCYFYLLLFCVTPFIKTVYQQFYFFSFFSWKKKRKKRKKKKTVEESSGPVQLSKVCCSSLDQVKLPPPHQYGHTNVQRVSPAPPRPNNKFRVLFDIVSFRPRPNVELFVRRTKL